MGHYTVCGGAGTVDSVCGGGIELDWAFLLLKSCGGVGLLWGGMPVVGG